jgi:hypothetical protein
MTDDQQHQRQEQQEQSHHHRSLIIGGVKAPLRRYPYFVSLSQTQGTEGECGGSLIAPDLFITAGHCLPERTIHKLKHRGDDADVAWARVGITAREELNDDFYFQSPNEIEQDFMVKVTKVYIICFLTFEGSSNISFTPYFIVLQGLTCYPTSQV